VLESTEVKSTLAEVDKNSQARIEASKALVPTIGDTAHAGWQARRSAQAD
jgi:hypothetical protein